MKRKDGFVLKEVMDKSIIIPFGEESLNLNGIVTLNETGKFLWEQMENDFSAESLSVALVDKYGISEELAAKDAENFIGELKAVGCIVD